MTHLSSHPTEQDLILYQLHEAPEEFAIRDHLDLCPTCAEIADSVAHTLRIFSAAPVPTPDLDQAWHRLRPRLPILAVVAAPRSRPLLRRPVLASIAGLALAALLLLTFLLPRHHAPTQPTVASFALHPLTPYPVNPAVAAHLDLAERFLTEVSHTSAPLDPSLREQAQTLLAHNALYVQAARNSGDLADAAVLEKLGLLLTAADHASPADIANGWHIRFELNANGLLLDLRILRQNQSQQAAGETQSTSTQDTLQ